jgi:hypothetical protein
MYSELYKVFDAFLSWSFDSLEKEKGGGEKLIMHNVKS